MSFIDLTDKEKQKPYAKYYYNPVKPVNQEILDFLAQGPIPYELAISIEERNALLKPETLPSEMGYCVFPDGTGYAAMLIKMPGVSLEMIDWWFMWHGLEDLRYRLWYPPAHFAAHADPKTLAHRLNTSLIPRERVWGTTDLVCENVGSGPANISISFLSPQDYGFDTSLLKGQTAICANAGLTDLNLPIITFTHVAREIEGGVELRSRFWEGMQIISGRPVNIAPPGGVSPEAVRGCAYHCAEEYTNLASFLPQLYKENKDIIDSISSFNY